MTEATISREQEKRLELRSSDSAEDALIRFAGLNVFDYYF